MFEATLRFPLSYDELVVLESIVGRSRFRVNDIVRDTGFSKPRVLRIVRRIQERWRLGIDIDYARLGLRRLILVLSEKPLSIFSPDYVSVMNVSIEGRFFLSYYVPYDYDYREILDYYSDAVEEYYLFTEFYTPKPNLREFFSDGEIVVDLKSVVSRVARELIESVDIGVSKESLDASAGSKNITLLDIKIIDLLSRNAFLTAKSIAQKLGEKISKINTHVRLMRRLGVFKGYVIRKYPDEYLGKLLFGILFVIRNYTTGQLRYIARIFRRIPLFGTIYLDPRTDTLMLQFAIKDKIIHLSSTLSLLLKESLNVEKTYIVSPVKMVRRIPEKEAFSKYKRRWVFNVEEASGFKSRL